MRLPTDSTLLLGDDADPMLAQVWREERLPVLPIGGGEPLEAALEAIGATTVVACGAGAQEAAARAAQLGFRTFLVDAASAPDGVQLATLAQALEAARAARALERWKAARSV